MYPSPALFCHSHFTCHSRFPALLTSSCQCPQATEMTRGPPCSLTPTLLWLTFDWSFDFHLAMAKSAAAAIDTMRKCSFKTGRSRIWRAGWILGILLRPGESFGSSKCSSLLSKFLCPNTESFVDHHANRMANLHGCQNQNRTPLLSFWGPICGVLLRTHAPRRKRGTSSCKELPWIYPTFWELLEPNRSLSSPEASPEPLPPKKKALLDHSKV